MFMIIMISLDSRTAVDQLSAVSLWHEQGVSLHIVNWLNLLQICINTEVPRYLAKYYETANLKTKPLYTTSVRIDCATGPRSAMSWAA